MAIEGGHTHQRGDLPPDLPYTGDSLEQLVFDEPEGTLFDPASGLFIDVLELLFQPSDMVEDAFVCMGRGHGQAILLGGDHIQELATPGNERLERL
ncbi:MAG: hypothetical protein ACHBNF_09315 [Chromatiales bacterium]